MRSIFLGSCIISQTFSHFLSFRYRRREEFERPRPGVLREGGAGGQEGGGYNQGGAKRKKMCNSIEIVHFNQNQIYDKKGCLLIFQPYNTILAS